MSIVGTRPPLISETNLYEPRHKVTVIYTTHGFTFTDKSSKKNWIVYFTAEKLMSRFCDAIITINHEDYNNAKKMHCPKAYIIPSVGLDNHRFANLRINRDEYRASFGVNSKDHIFH